jgi:hypothetical protein
MEREREMQCNRPNQKQKISQINILIFGFALYFECNRKLRKMWIVLKIRDMHFIYQNNTAYFGDSNQECSISFEFPM